MQGSANYCIFLTIEENEKKKFHDMRTLYKTQILLPQIVLKSPPETQQHTHWLTHCLWMFLNFQQQS